MARPPNKALEIASAAAALAGLSSRDVRPRKDTGCSVRQLISVLGSWKRTRPRVRPMK